MWSNLQHPLPWIPHSGMMCHICWTLRSRIRSGSPTPSGSYHTSMLASRLQLMPITSCGVQPKKSWLVSDIERNPHEPYTMGHAVPIQYGMSGFSLNMTTALLFFQEAIDACLDKELCVRAYSFDQFSELSMKNGNGKPLSVYAFQREFWYKVKKMERKSQLDYLLRLRSLPSSENRFSTVDIVRTTSGIQLGSLSETRVVGSPSNIAKDCKITEDPDDIIKNIDTAPIAKEASETCTMQEVDYEAALVAMNAADDTGTGSKWSSLSVDEFKLRLAFAEGIHREFTVKHLRILMAIQDSNADNRKTRKSDFVNRISRMYGDETTAAGHKKTTKIIEGSDSKTHSQLEYRCIECCLRTGDIHGGAACMGQQQPILRVVEHDDRHGWTFQCTTMVCATCHHFWVSYRTCNRPKPPLC